MNEVMTQYTELQKIKGKYILRPSKGNWQSAWLKRQDKNQEGAKVGEAIFGKALTYVSPELEGPDLVRTGLTEAQAREFEIALNVPKNSLSPYNRAFWGNHKINVRVPPDGLLIDCDRSTMEKLQYCFLAVSSRVAKDKITALENPLYEFVLISEEHEIQVDSKTSLSKRDAYKKLESLTLDTQRDFLTIYKSGKYKVSSASTLEHINAAMGKVLEDDPNGFMETISNPLFKDFVFLKKAISSGLVRQEGSVYKTIGGDIIGDTFERAVYNLNAPDFNAVKLSLLTKMEAKK